MQLPTCDYTDPTVETPPEVHAIERQTLQQLLDDSADFALVMAMDQRRFEMAHIDGSISYDTLMDELDSLPKDRQIVMYCTDVDCIASKARAGKLVDEGFTNVYRYAGGLADWVDAGLPLITG